jgi:hypothetical protein
VSSNWFNLKYSFALTEDQETEIESLDTAKIISTRKIYDQSQVKNHIFGFRIGIRVKYM